MKTTSLHIAFAALLSLLLLASCSRNDEVAVAEGEEGKVYVTLTLSINGEEVGSRATWEYNDNDNPGDGNEWENTIDDLQILIYDANNNYVGKVEDLIQLLDGRYSGTLSSDAEWTGNTNYKIMAFANCPSIDNPSNISTLDYTRANVSYIPMWGVTTTTFDLTPGESDDIGSIDLLRAMAKVEVIMDADGYTIDNIAVDKSNTQGYCLPKGYDSVSETEQLDMEGTDPASFHPFTTFENPPIKKEQDGKYYIYLPEYENTETNAAKIKVTVNGEPYELEFKNYENGTPTGAPYDIVRNHIYRYTITGVNDGELTFEYRVLLWDEVESQIGWNGVINDRGNAPMAAWPSANFNEPLKVDKYGFADPDFKNAKEGDKEATFCYVLYPRYADENHTTLENHSSFAAFYFRLQEPKGAIWEAHLSNDEYFTLNTEGKHDSNGDNKEDSKCAVRGIAREKPYQIQIGAKYSWNDINIEKHDLYTDLYIRISIDGGNTWNYLDINKEDCYADGGYIEHTYWGKRRFASKKDNYIRIWQLNAVANKGLDELVEDLDNSWGIKQFWDEYDKPSE